MTEDATRDAATALTRGMNVVALAGRRIDAEDSPVARFPLNHVDAVRDAIRVTLREAGAQAVVCSAACGADLLALEVAHELGLRSVIVLPFAAERFRATSVTDRPGDWGPLFDRLVNAGHAHGALIVAEQVIPDHVAYLHVTELVLQQAIALSWQTPEGKAAAQPGQVTAVVVWEGAPRAEDDLTAHFAARAQALGISIHTVRT